MATARASDPLPTIALVLAGGAGGYALGRFVIARWLQPRRTPVAASPAAPALEPTATAAPSAPARSIAASAHEASPSAHATAAPAPPPPRPRSPGRRRPARGPRPARAPDQAAPVSSPSQVDPDPVAPPIDADGPVSSPSQVDPEPPRAALDADDAAPVSSPSQVDPGPHGAPLAQDASPPTPQAKGRALPRRFDPIFERYRGSIPIEYLRALAWRESGMNPGQREGAAWGLMQIVEEVRTDYNQRHGTSYTREHLLDPAVNVAMCCWLLRTIIAAWARRHPEIPNLRADWTNPRFVELLTQAWNGGWSDSGGLGRVARYLKARGITDVTVDVVHAHAAAAGAVRHLSSPRRLAWVKSVAQLYQRERSLARRTRNRSALAIKTPGVILAEMGTTKNEIESLGRDIYATFRRPFEAQLAAAEDRFRYEVGREPGVGPEGRGDYRVIRSWMNPAPTDADWRHKTYQGPFVHQWSEFEKEWGVFWASHADSWTDRMWRGTYDQALDYRRRAIAWRRRFEEMGGTPTTPTPTVPAERWPSIPWKPIAAIGGVALGAIVLVPAALRALRGDR